MLSENHAMLTVLRESGLYATRYIDGSTVVVSLTTAGGAALLRRADGREFCAEAAALAPLLGPRSVAVVGVRSDGTGIGATVLHSIVAGGFRGEVSMVHPRADRIGDVLSYSSLGEVPGPLDLVVICVPASAAESVLREAGAAGARAAVVVSSGFGEVGADGAVLQHRLAATARELGIRMVGPNCLGVLLNDPEVSLNATFQEAVPPPWWARHREPVGRCRDRDAAPCS